MISQYSKYRTGWGTGWAMFSDDMKMRYRLARCFKPGPGAAIDTFRTHNIDNEDGQLNIAYRDMTRIVFLMLNPSTADAFKLDPTVNECRKRSIALGADMLEVVNLFALRSPYPTDLRKAARGSRGDDTVNDQAIINACLDARMVIAAWGNGGDLDNREAHVLKLLREHDIKLHHRGRTNGGAPKHPLARGRHRIPADLQPIPWETT